MFDNPNEELKKLEDQLLAVENKDEDFESFYNDILREFGPVNENQGVRKSESKPVTPKKAPTKAKTTGKKGKKKAKKGIKGLVITLCLECAGIVAIILWWVLRIL